MSNLARGVQADVTVTEVRPFFDTTPGGAVCHGLTFSIEGQEYVGQICGPNENPQFKVGDTLSITVKAFSRNTHTLEVRQIIPSSAFPEKPQAMDELPKQKIVNILTGTVNEHALRNAVNFYANRVATDADVIKTANIFKQFLLS